LNKIKAFRRGVARLYENGYQTLSLLGVVDCLCQGKPFPTCSFVITFDDGYQTVYDEAFPVLQRYGMAATIEIMVESTGKALMEC
jgi:biofilm PGA synthesis lipoprotein PgaB